MKTLVTQQQIDDYRENGFLLIENFLDTDELPFWREAVTETVEQRGDRKLPGKETKTGEDDGINKDADYYGKVFDQMLNLVDATLENGCLYFIPGSYHSTTSENPGIGKNMDEVFKFYLQFFTSKSVALPMKAGSCSFHNGLTILRSRANMTNGFRNVLAYYEGTFKNKPSWQLTFKEKSISIISSFSHKIILLGIESVTVC